MSFFHFRKFGMSFLKGVVSICRSFRNTGQPGRINGFDAFKLSIYVVTPVLAKIQILLLSAPYGETKAENIYDCPKVCECCGQFIRTNLFEN